MCSCTRSSIEGSGRFQRYFLCNSWSNHGLSSRPSCGRQARYRLSSNPYLLNNGSKNNNTCGTERRSNHRRRRYCVRRLCCGPLRVDRTAVVLVGAVRQFTFVGRHRATQGAPARCWRTVESHWRLPAIHIREVLAGNDTNNRHATNPTRAIEHCLCQSSLETTAVERQQGRLFIG